jgi:hypothetical protein
MNRRIIALTVTILATFALLAGTPAAAPAAPTCDPAAAMNTRLDQLGRNGYVWIITDDVPVGAGGAVFEDAHVVKISPAMCDRMVSVVNHEWAHTQQTKLYPGRAAAAYGDELEPTADCASQLLGSVYTPYLERRGYGCTEYEIQSAHTILKG